MSELKAGRTKKLSAKTAQVIFNTLQIPLNTLLGIDIVAAELNTTPEYLTGETACPEIKKGTILSGDVDAELLGRLIWLTPEELAKVDAFVQGLLASR